MKLQLTDITIKQGRRAVDESKVRELSQSMAEIGLINPITVTRDKTLITGAHRLAAAKLLGWTEIEATEVDLNELLEQLHEIDENLMRNELHYIDRGNAIKRRDELLKAYGKRATVGRPENSPESGHLKTTSEIAKDMGVSKSKLLEEKQIARDILPEAQEAIKAADLPNLWQRSRRGRDGKQAADVAGKTEPLRGMAKGPHQGGGQRQAGRVQPEIHVGGKRNERASLPQLQPAPAHPLV